MNECKRCLLLEAGDKVTHGDIMLQLSLVDKGNRADTQLYNHRLNLCQSCDQLLSGICRKCGCYVEYRAGILNNHCPNADNTKW
ncbi:MAG: DUF6171 family protein [Eubacterium sp.]